MDDTKNNETIIYLDRSTLIARMALGIILAAALTYLIAVLNHDYSEGYIITIAFALFSYFIIFKHVYLLIAHKPQIIINTNGVQLPPAKLDAWDEIGNIKFEKVQVVRAKNTLFIYTVLAKNGTSTRREINISYLDINNKIQLNELLNKYRLQFYVHTKQQMIPLPGIDHSEE